MTWMIPSKFNVLYAVVIVLVGHLVVGPWIGGLTWERERGDAWRKEYRCEQQYQQWEAQNPGRVLKVTVDGSACGTLTTAVR